MSTCVQERAATRRHLGRNARVVICSAAVLSGACADDVTGPLQPGTQPTVVQDDTRMSEFPALQRVSLTLRASGTFRPGEPVTIQAVVRANRPSLRTDVELFVIDDPDATRAATGSVRRLERLTTSFAAKAEREVPATEVTFPAAGYYRIGARAVSRGEPSEAARSDTAILDMSPATLWVLIDEQGGRVTRDYDTTAVGGRAMRYGSYGAFTSAQAEIAADPTACGMGSNPGCTWVGIVKYHNDDVGQLVPLPFAFVTAFCVRVLQSPGFSQVGFQGHADANGAFTMTCGAGFESMSMNVGLHDGSVEVAGKDGIAAGGSSGYFQGGGTVEHRVINDYAAHVFKTLHENVPRGNTMFSRSRGNIRVWVAATDPNYGIFYSPSADRIQTNFTRVFGQDGYFVSLHEYGHAFQRVAIEPWRSYSCSGGTHSINVADNLNCAFVEGFADFYAGWVGGPGMTTGWTSGFITDNAVEQNPWRSLGDGSRIEGAVAAFFYDLVDGVSEPDGPGNTADGEESFDGATYPGLYVADVLRTCAFPSSFGTQITQLDGIDEFIYCAERTLSGRTLGVGWRSYVGFSESATEPPSWSQPMIRRLWRYNLYNVAP